MGRWLTRILAIRLVFFALPFVGWLVWRWVARLAGRPVQATPWAWLVAGGALLAALTLVASAVLPGAPDTGTYVPGHVRPDGTVTRGYFIPRR